MWILKRVQKELMAQEQLEAATAGKTLTDTVACCSLRTAFSESVCEFVRQTLQRFDLQSHRRASEPIRHTEMPLKQILKLCCQCCSDVQFEKRRR